MNLVVAAGSEARHLIGLNVGHNLRVGIVGCAFLEAARAEMTMQALSVVVWMVEM